MDQLVLILHFRRLAFSRCAGYDWPAGFIVEACWPVQDAAMATIIKLWPLSYTSVHEIGHLAFPCDTEALGFQRPDRDLNDISDGIR